jgi:AraC family transcriptional regulator, arabinose operon regulatory protein
MPRPTVSKSHFPVSLFATPSPAHQDIFYTVPRAGHLVGGPDHHVRRDHFPGHELILCLRGQGWVRIAGRTHPVKKNHFVWVDCHQPHEHGAIKSSPWEVLWVRVEGPRLARMCEILSTREAPVFPEFDMTAAMPLYREIFCLMKSSSPEAPARIHAAVAQLLALAFCARQKRPAQISDVPLVLRKAVERMKLFYFERLRVDELAELAGMSSSHFSRVFRKEFGASPIDWLRRERISQAKRRLVETSNAIKEIAEQVGYSDRFFFSKDFKKLTGLTPREFRNRERQEAAAKSH